MNEQFVFSSLIRRFTPFHNCSKKGRNGNFPLDPHLLTPSRVKLTMSITPPVGCASNPSRPFPIPLKKPSTPSERAPKVAKKKKDSEALATKQKLLILVNNLQSQASRLPTSAHALYWDITKLRIKSCPWLPCCSLRMRTEMALSRGQCWRVSTLVLAFFCF